MSRLTFGVTFFALPAVRKKLRGMAIVRETWEAGKYKMVELHNHHLFT